ncbi:GNAT family N-acetyltransferase [Streptomyces sp. NPDC051940]|uniref:GNAT family N-acetyltransferase n=1 Tax=Streptomyces sp. NPDC051940 TaxID=3155675 RepID=UPI00343DC55E
MLRDVDEADLPAFFEYQKDPEAVRMAAFTAENPGDREAFDAHWARLLDDDTVVNRTIVFTGDVIGWVGAYEADGRREITYWLAREYWGKGLATQALTEFLHLIPERPLYARAATDNVGSLRVLEKLGFVVVGEDSGYAAGRGKVTDEFLLELVR